jgi:6-phosphofructokinase 2
MHAQTPIVTVTLNPAVDMSTSTGALVPQRKLRCEHPVREPGGGGINVARVVGILGGEACAVCTKGGVVGDLLEKLLRECRIRCEFVTISGETRENVSIEDRSSGALYRFVMPGPEVSAEEFDRVAHAVRAALGDRPEGAVLVISGSMCQGVPDDLFQRVIPAARERGVRVFADVSGAWLERAARAGASFLKPNQHELEEHLGRLIDSDDDLLHAAESLRAKGDCEVVFVSLGAAGLLCACREGSFRVNAPAVHVESTIGAGDSTVAGIALALARGASLRDAARMGVAAGSATCMTAGTQLCRREDVERLLRQIG